MSRRSRGEGRYSRRRPRAGLATPYPQAGPFPHRFALGDRSGSARKRVPSPIASLWGTDPVSTGGAGEGVGAPDVGVARVWRPPTRKRVPSPLASLWGTDPVVPASGSLSPSLRSGGQTRACPQAGPFPHRVALGDRSGSARKRVPSPIASLWGTDPVVPASGSLPPSLRSGGQIR